MGLSMLVHHKVTPETVPRVKPLKVNTALGPVMVTVMITVTFALTFVIVTKGSNVEMKFGFSVVFVQLDVAVTANVPDMDEPYQTAAIKY